MLPGLLRTQREDSCPICSGMSLAIFLVITVQALVIVLLLWHTLRRRRLSGLAISERQAGCAHAGEAVWTLANG